MEQANFLTIFLTGLLTGGLTCMAVQGGLLAATIAQRQEEKLKENLNHTGHVFPILSFLIAKLIAYTILGFFLGWFGSFFQLSIATQVTLQIAVAVFMIGTALNILEVHPIFRYFVIQSPKFLTRLIRNQTRSKDLFAPALLGAFTVFIPCGTTQAMMALAIASGNPFVGSTILFTFILGTSPVFFVLGYFANRLGSFLQAKFLRLAALVLLSLALFNINSALKLTGTTLIIQNLWEQFYCTALSFCESSNVLAARTPEKTVEEATITIGQSGYTPNNLTVKAGLPVTLHLVNQGGGGCVQAFTIPKFNIQKVVPPGKSDSVQFTAPKEPGEIAFSCSMGMYTGKIKVI